MGLEAEEEYNRDECGLRQFRLVLFGRRDGNGEKGTAELGMGGQGKFTRLLTVGQVLSWYVATKATMWAMLP